MSAPDQILATFLTKVADAYRAALDQHDYMRLAEAARQAEQLAAPELECPPAAPPAHSPPAAPDAGLEHMDLSTPLSRVTIP